MSLHASLRSKNTHEAANMFNEKNMLEVFQENAKTLHYCPNAFGNLANGKIRGYEGRNIVGVSV